MEPDLWPKGIEAAREIQRALKEKIRIAPLQKKPEYVAAADAAFCGDIVFSVASLYRVPGLIHLSNASSESNAGFDYVPAFLAFREGKTIIEAIRKLRISPDVILIDGQGIAHPEGVGIASHIGVLLNVPTVGCAKTRLVGDYEQPASKKGSWTYLYYRGMKVGAVLRTKSNVKPLFVSPGHMIDIESSIEMVMECVTNYRIPEPLRTADRLSKKMKRDRSEDAGFEARTLPVDLQEQKRG